MKWRWTSQLRMQMNVWTAGVILVPLETVWEHATNLHAVKNIYHTLLTWVVQLLCLWVFCKSHHVSSSQYRKAEVLPKPRRHWDDSTLRPTDRLDLHCRRCLYMKAKAPPSSSWRPLSAQQPEKFCYQLVSSYTRHRERNSWWSAAAEKYSCWRDRFPGWGGRPPLKRGLTVSRRKVG